MSASNSLQTNRYIVPLLSTLPVFLIILGAILTLSSGHFTYSLDDPYIHMALAKNIWHGSYSINMGEPSAPASSILWPLMLAPFASLGALFEYVPLVFNLLFLFAFSYVVDRAFSDLDLLKRLVINFFLLLSINVFGIAFNGMEHNLQVLLVALAVYPFLKPGGDFKEVKFGAISILAIILLPLVRYEGLSISLPMVGYLFFTRQYKLSIATFLGFIIPMLGFSLFLYSQGLGHLPSSIMAKSAHGSSQGILINLSANIRTYGYFLIPTGVAIVYFWKKNWVFSMVLLTSTMMYYTFGKYGWFGRYEVYHLIFMYLIFIRLVVNMDHKYAYYMVFLPLGYSPLLKVTYNTPMAASNVYHQHAQLGEIVHELNEPVAVNDLGMVAFRSDKYVLDIWGLASVDALSARTFRENEVWIDELMEKKGVHYAMMYEAWYKIPPSFIKVGGLYLDQKKVTPTYHEVAFFATDSTAADKLKAVMLSYDVKNTSKHVRINIYY